MANLEIFNFSRTVNSVVFAEEYGAVGDGTTDDTDAIQDAIDAVLSIGSGVVQLLGKQYKVSNIMCPSVNPFTGQKTVEFRGVCHHNSIFGTLGTAPQSTKGTILKSAATSGAVLSAGSYSGSFNGLRLVVRDMVVRSYNNPNIVGIDAGFANFYASSNVMIDNGVYTVDSLVPTHSQASGLITPKRGNGAQTHLINNQVSGYYTGIEVGEHTYGSGVSIWGCGNGLDFKTADQSSHFTRALICRTIGPVFVSGAHRFKINNLQIEHSASGWSMTTADVYDPSNLGDGRIEYSTIEEGGATFDVWTKNGGKNVITGPLNGLPQWTTTGRPTLSGKRYIGYNTTTGKVELANGGSYTDLY